MRYFLELSYKGTAYSGWQRQQEGPGVQGTIESKLSLILRNEVELYGCGRTDTGVHAEYFVAHFDFDHALPSNLVYRLNGLLPRDIAVFSCRQVPDEFHARFSAISRTYIYKITHHKNPFTDGLQWHLPFQPDVEIMNRAAALLLKHEEYRCFCKGKAPKDNYKCTVTFARWNQTRGGLEFTISANRFLRSMVRSTVGTLLKVGFGKMSLEAFERLLLSGNRSDAGKSVPPQGLYLHDVRYPEFERSTESNL
jgi:tRNA pseudouridine38-40 synthase